jgi:hypothetical protein
VEGSESCEAALADMVGDLTQVAIHMCIWQGPIANLDAHLSDPSGNNAWNYATKFVPGN